MQNEAETPPKSTDTVARWLRWLPLRAFLWVGLIAAFLSLFRSTLGQATDFEVFWTVGQALAKHLSFYDVTQDTGMIFKYPPWIAILFYPLAWVDFVTGKGLWALVELLSLMSVIWSLRRDFRVSEFAILALFPLYWGIWVVHFLDGQIMLPVLAVFLFFLARPKWDSSTRGIVPLLMSVKIFTLFPMLAVLDRFKNKRAIYSTIVLLISFSAGTAFLSYDGNIALMMHKWSEAAASGGRLLEPGQTRGSKSQSVVSFFCRVTQVPTDHVRTEVLLSGLLFAAAFLLLRWRKTPGAQSRWGDLTPIDFVFIYLALTPPLHPLPWHHLYVWTFPLAVYRFDRDNKKPFYWFAIFLLTLSSTRAIPIFGVGEFLEWNVGRAWGALLLVAQTVFSKTKSMSPAA